MSLTLTSDGSYARPILPTNQEKLKTAWESTVNSVGKDAASRKIKVAVGEFKGLPDTFLISEGYIKYNPDKHVIETGMAGDYQSPERSTNTLQGSNFVFLKKLDIIASKFNNRDEVMQALFLKFVPKATEFGSFDDFIKRNLDASCLGTLNKYVEGEQVKLVDPAAISDARLVATQGIKEIMSRVTEKNSITFTYDEVDYSLFRTPRRNVILQPTNHKASQIQSGLFYNEQKFIDSKDLGTGVINAAIDAFNERYP